MLVRSLRPGPATSSQRPRPYFTSTDGALLFQLGLHLRGLVLRDAGLHGLRRAIDEILGFLQAKTRQLAHDLDDLDLLGAGFLEDDVELGLLFDGRRSRRAHRHHRRRRPPGPPRS